MLPPALPPAVIILSGFTPSLEAFSLLWYWISNTLSLDLLKPYPFHNVEAIIDRVGEFILRRHAIVNARNNSVGVSCNHPVLDLLDLMAANHPAYAIDQIEIQVADIARTAYLLRAL